MGQITYSLICGVKDMMYKGGATFSASMTRNETPPSGAIPLSADIRFTDIHVWSTKKPYLKFGDYFTTAGLSQNSGEFQKVAIDDFSSTILDVSSADITVTIKGLSSDLNALDFDSTSATLVVEYEESYSSSTSKLSNSSIEAGKALQVDFSNDKIANIKHTVTWAFGSDSKYSTTTSIGATSASYTIPYTWLNEIPNATSGAGTVTIQAYSSDNTLLGTQTLSFTLKVPSSVVPTVSALTATRINNSVPSSWSIYVQNQSGVK